MEQWRKNLYFAWLAQVLCAVGFSAAFPFIPFYLQDLGVTDPDQLKIWVGWITTGSAVTMAVFSPIWGALADRYGRKIMILRAAFVGAVMIFLMAFAQNATQLLVLRTIQGIFTGVVAAFTTLVACNTPREKIGFGLGMIQMAAYAGHSGGPLVGGFIADAFGYRVAFMSCGVMLFLGGMIAWRLVQEQFTPPVRKRSSFLKETRSLFNHRSIVIMTIVLFSLQFTSSMVRPMLPLFIQDLQTSNANLATITGFIQGAAALSSAIGAALIGRFADRLGHRLVLIVCSLGAALFYLPQAFVHTTLYYLLTDVTIGVFLGGLMPSANAVIALNVDQGKQGATYGMTASASAAARSMGPMIGSAVAVGWDIRTLFPTATVLYVLIALGVAAVVPKGQQLASAVPAKEA